MKKLTLLVFLLFSFVAASVAQRSIMGTVSDTNNEPLIGASVLAQGTSVGTVTDLDGSFSLDVPEGTTALEVSYTGFSTKLVDVTGVSNVTVQLSEGELLDEVVVTALGISRDKKSLGYATQEVKGEELANNKSGNFVNAIAGKASGVQIRKNNNMGGSTNVVIRGNSSLTGSNQALFVVDGVPINNTNTNSAGQSQAVGGYYDYGNAASDINSDDIESINILKGAAASALYGSRAANGVVIITTKKGNSSKGIGITVNSGITLGLVDKSTFAKYQKEYGAGYGPYYDGPGGNWYEEDIDGDGALDLVVPYTEDGSWGAKFDPNLLVYQWDALDPESPNYKKKTPWVAAKNDPTTFFEKPVTYNTSISFERGLENGAYRLNFTNFNQSGLMPNSSIKKYNFSMNGSLNLTDKLKVTSFANYINTNGLGRNSTGYNGNIISNFKQWWQTNVDVQKQKEIYFKTRRNVTWNPSTSSPNSTPIYWDNPYFKRYENYQTDSRNRILGNVSLTYDFTDWLSLTGRVATDTYSELQEERRANGSNPGSFGVLRDNVSSGYLRRDISNTETNYDAMLNFNKDLSERISLKGILGMNIRRNHFRSLYSSTAGGLNVPKLYSLQNSVGTLPPSVERDERIGVNGVYASASFGLDRTYFVDATIRRDHSSTLPKGHSVFYYPSIATSFVFSNLIESEVMSFGKLRANYAEVGNSAPFDYLYDTYDINIAPGSLSTSVNRRRKNPDLKPETTKSIELGVEMKFLLNRLGVDVAYYKNNSVDQIFGVPVSNATGYSSKILNAGEIQNSGIELSLTGVPVRNENFTWSTTVNWSKNKNMVVSLEDGIGNLQLGSFQGGVTINARVGEPYGVIQGTDYTYKDGKKLVDASNGQYIPTSESDKIIGDSNPDWLMGISNSINYKGLSIGFLIDVQQGGSIFSLDQYYGLATGIYAETAFTNDLGNPVRNSIADGGGFINEGVNEDGSVNTTRIRMDRFGALGYRRGLPKKAFVYDASYVKLREVSISYALPRDLFKGSVVQGASLSLVGTNLWIISKNLPHADPESGLSSGNLQGYSVGSLPTTRDIGFNLKVQF